MNLCRCCNVLYLIHFHWKLTRFSLYPVVLSLIGLSGTDWNLINLLNGFDCCGIPIVCSECILQRQKDTGALLDYYLCALKTIFFCSSEIRTLRHFFLFFLRSFLKFNQNGLILSWKMGASLFKYRLCLYMNWLQLPYSPLHLYYYLQGKERCFFMSSFPFLFSCFTTDLICGKTQHRWNALLIRLYYVYICLFHFFSVLSCFFYQRFSR